jgi:hypothetical protein
MTQTLPAAAVISGGTTEPIGWFRYDVIADSWTWSDALYAMHGFTPGEIVPSTGIFLAHKHPDDRAATSAVLQAALATGEPFCCRHRIVDVRQRVFTVVAIGRGTLNPAGTVIALDGYFVDVTDSTRRDTAAQVRVALERSADTRGVIEQAKGALMLIHGLRADEAFEVLRWHSQHANIKIRDLATAITEALSYPGDRNVVATIRRISAIFANLALAHPAPRSGRDPGSPMLSFTRPPWRLTPASTSPR